MVETGGTARLAFPSRFLPALPRDCCEYARCLCLLSSCRLRACCILCFDQYPYRERSDDGAYTSSGGFNPIGHRGTGRLPTLFPGWLPLFVCPRRKCFPRSPHYMLRSPSLAVITRTLWRKCRRHFQGSSALFTSPEEASNRLRFRSQPTRLRTYPVPD